MNAAARLQEALYAPTSRQLIEPLPAIADVVHERLDALVLAPSIPDVDALLRDLGGLTASLMKLRLALAREAEEGQEVDRGSTESSLDTRRP